jgi:hypothetical protein
LLSSVRIFLAAICSAADYWHIAPSSTNVA